MKLHFIYLPVNVCVFASLSVDCDIKHIENRSSKGYQMMLDILKNVGMVAQFPVNYLLPLCLSASQALHLLSIKLVLVQMLAWNTLRLNLHEPLDSHQYSTIVCSDNLLFVQLQGVLQLIKDKQTNSQSANAETESPARQIQLKVAETNVLKAK